MLTASLLLLATTGTPFVMPVIDAKTVNGQVWDSTSNKHYWDRTTGKIWKGEWRTLPPLPPSEAAPLKKELWDLVPIETFIAVAAAPEDERTERAVAVLTGVLVQEVDAMTGSIRFLVSVGREKYPIKILTAKRLAEVAGMIGQKVTLTAQLSPSYGMPALDDDSGEISLSDGTVKKGR